MSGSTYACTSAMHSQTRNQLAGVVSAILLGPMLQLTAMLRGCYPRVMPRLHPWG